MTAHAPRNIQCTPHRIHDSVDRFLFSPPSVLLGPYLIRLPSLPLDSELRGLQPDASLPRVFCCTCSSFPQKLFPADAPVSGRPSRTSHQKGTPPAAIYHRPLTPSVAIRDQSILETDEVTGFLPNGPTEMDLRSAASKRVTFFRTATVCGREQATEQLL